MTWWHAMEVAERRSRFTGRRYAVTGRRHTFGSSAFVWLYSAGPVTR